MLGIDLVEYLKENTHCSLMPLTINEMDITNRGRVIQILAKNRPDVVIHCAGYTEVDKAERNPQPAFSINAAGTQNLAMVCKEIGAEMIYISTDYVFDGTKSTPYVETDTTNPLNVYGASKLRGERLLQEQLRRFKIVRTAWLHGIHCPFRKNFIEAILSHAESSKEPLKVVNDQYGTPTFTIDLSKAIAALMDVTETGIFHATNEGSCNWYEFAVAVAEEFGLEDAAIIPIPSSEWKFKTPRPKNSMLENQHLKSIGLPPLQHWRDGLAEYHRRRDNA